MRLKTIRLRLDHGDLDYSSDTDLGIKMNNVIDDFQQVDKRFGDFSYTFSVPKTKNNAALFEWPDTKGRTGIFRGKLFNCTGYLDSDQFLNGIIELTGYDNKTYKCVLYSQVRQLIDDLNGKKLVDLSLVDSGMSWNYEVSIHDHINAGYDIDDKPYQFIYSFYKTPFMANALGDKFDVDKVRKMSYAYNYMISTLLFGYGNKNPYQWQNFPPAFYLVSIFKQILIEAGWSLGGSFFEDEDIRKQIIAFTGDDEAYVGAVTTGETSTTINLNKLLPDLDQSEFIKGVINTYNLYFKIDPISKRITFETYNTYRGAGLLMDLTKKIDYDSVEVSAPANEYKILLKDDDNNKLVAGYGRPFRSYFAISGDPNPARVFTVTDVLNQLIDLPYIKQQYASTAFSNVWEKQTGDKELNLPFAACNYYNYTLFNERSIGNNTYSDTRQFTLGIPLISNQTPTDDNGTQFASDTGQTYCSEYETTFKGGLKLLYYYGPMGYNYVFTTMGSNYYNWCWFGLLAAGGTCTVPSMYRMRIPCASPFKLMSNNEKSNLINRLSTLSQSELLSAVGAEMHYLLSTWYTNGTVGDTHTPTKYSLTFGDFDATYDNIYTYFHKRKVEELRNGAVLEGDIYLTPLEYRSLQLETPISYNGENYRLISVTNWEPVTGLGKISMLKV